MKYLSSKNQRKGSIDQTKKDDEFIFQMTDGTATLSGRDQYPLLRQEPTVRSEDLSGEIQGEPEDSPPTQSTDDAEARGDFWSI